MVMHKLHLHKQPFEMVGAGLKTIEARLYDERRQRIEIGDEIMFISRETNKTQEVVVHKLHRAPTFHDLFVMCDPAKFGGTTPGEMAKLVEQYYDYSEQQRYGVLGIEFVVKR